jgi:hypothetical protein
MRRNDSTRMNPFFHHFSGILAAEWRLCIGTPSGLCVTWVESMMGDGELHWTIRDVAVVSGCGTGYSGFATVFVSLRVF